jgi:hypothetical protein
MGKSQHRLVARALIWIAGCVVAALAIGSTWSLAIPISLGQTIPWWTRTPTSGPTGTTPPAPTWTALPTWTPLPTAVPSTAVPLEQTTPTLGPTTEAPPGTRTPTAGGQPSPTAPATATSTNIPAAPPPTPTPAPPTFYVEAQQLVAGPGDMVNLVARIANVGYAPAYEITVQAQVPWPLQVLQVECRNCSMSQILDAVTVSAPQILPGDQLLVSIACQVAWDALPGQTVKTTWEMAAREGPPQLQHVAIELPWAELPAAGLPADHRPPDRRSEGGTTCP